MPGAIYWAIIFVLKKISSMSFELLNHFCVRRCYAVGYAMRPSLQFQDESDERIGWLLY